jgi:hypothetical protein
MYARRYDEEELFGIRSGSRERKLDPEIGFHRHECGQTTGPPRRGD